MRLSVKDGKKKLMVLRGIAIVLGLITLALTLYAGISANYFKVKSNYVGLPGVDNPDSIPKISHHANKSCVTVPEISGVVGETKLCYHFDFVKGNNSTCSWRIPLTVHQSSYSLLGIFVLLLVIDLFSRPNLMFSAIAIIVLGFLISVGTLLSLAAVATICEVSYADPIMEASLANRLCTPSGEEYNHPFAIKACNIAPSFIIQSVCAVLLLVLTSLAVTLAIVNHKSREDSFKYRDKNKGVYV